MITASAGSPQGTKPGVDFTSKLAARLSDSYGNGISGKMVKFSAPTNGASATFPSGDSGVTDAFGDATVIARANMVAGSYNVTAVPMQVTLPQGAIFQLSNYTPLQMWRADNFGSWENSGNGANTAAPFNDGVPNLLKYAFNLNAKGADFTIMTAAGVKGLPLVQRDQQGRLTVTFVRRRAATFPAVSYTVQFSAGLTSDTFAENPAATTSTPVAIDATWERVVVTDSVTAAPRFVRVQVGEL